MITIRSHVNYRRTRSERSGDTERPGPNHAPAPPRVPTMPERGPPNVPANDDDADAVREVPLAVPFTGPAQQADRADREERMPFGVDALLPPPTCDDDDVSVRVFRLHEAVARQRTDRATASSVDQGPVDGPVGNADDHAYDAELASHVERLVALGNRWCPPAVVPLEPDPELVNLHELALVPEDERPWTVYAILDPRTDLPVYVGMSGQPGRRLRLHKLWATQRPLKKPGPRRRGTYRYLPMMRIAELCPRFVRLAAATSRSDALAKERAWMIRLTALGVPLVNARLPMVRPDKATGSTKPSGATEPSGATKRGRGKRGRGGEGQGA